MLIITFTFLLNYYFYLLWSKEEVRLHPICFWRMKETGRRKCSQCSLIVKFHVVTVMDKPIFVCHFSGDGMWSWFQVLFFYRYLSLVIMLQLWLLKNSWLTYVTRWDFIILVVGGCDLSTFHHNTFHCKVHPIPLVDLLVLTYELVLL